MDAENPCRCRNIHPGQNLVFKPAPSCKDGVMWSNVLKEAVHFILAFIP